MATLAPRAAIIRSRSPATGARSRCGCRSTARTIVVLKNGSAMLMPWHRRRPSDPWGLVSQRRRRQCGSGRALRLRESLGKLPSRSRNVWQNAPATAGAIRPASIIGATTAKASSSFTVTSTRTPSSPFSPSIWPLVHDLCLQRSSIVPLDSLTENSQRTGKMKLNMHVPEHVRTRKSRFVGLPAPPSPHPRATEELAESS